MVSSYEQEIDLEKELREAVRRHSDFEPQNISDSLLYSLTAPGKRIRPRLCLRASQILGLPKEAALPVALSLEMIHCFSLIHDDLPCMGDDDFRRGKPSNHKVFGEGLSLLAGDALLVLAFAVFGDCAEEVDHPNFRSAYRMLFNGIGPRGLVGGQAREMLLGKDSRLSDLEQVHLGKTGALFQISLSLPRVLVGLESESKKGAAIDQFGTEIGLAFQIADDLDDSIQDQGREPTSVTYYEKPIQAAQRTHARLKQASEDLKEQFGASSEPLHQVASEVLRSLEKHL